MKVLAAAYVAWKLQLRPHSIILASCKPGRKQVESMSKANCELAQNVFFLHSICLARARTSEPAAVRDQVFDKKVESWSKACRKPARTCRKPGCKPGRKPGLQPGLQLARIMECGLTAEQIAGRRNQHVQQLFITPNGKMQAASTHWRVAGWVDEDRAMAYVVTSHGSVSVFKSVSVFDIGISKYRDILFGISAF